MRGPSTRPSRGFNISGGFPRVGASLRTIEKPNSMQSPGPAAGNWRRRPITGSGSRALSRAFCAPRSSPDMWARLIALCSRLRFAITRRRLDEETRYEIGTHLDLLVDNYIRSGLTPEEAYVRARRQFGNVTLVRQEIYEMNGI